MVAIPSIKSSQVTITLCTYSPSKKCQNYNLRTRSHTSWHLATTLPLGCTNSSIISWKSQQFHKRKIDAACVTRTWLDMMKVWLLDQLHKRMNNGQQVTLILGYSALVKLQEQQIISEILYDQIVKSSTRTGVKMHQYSLVDRLHVVI